MENSMVTTITLGNHMLEKTNEFRYLELTITHSHDTSYEIKQGSIAASRAYFSSTKLPCSAGTILSRATKVTIYKTLTKTVLRDVAINNKRFLNSECFQKKNIL